MPRKPASPWRAWPAAGSAAESGLDCAGELCRYTARGRTVAIVTGEAALPVKCRGLDAIVSQVPAGFHCRSMMPVIDRIDSWRRGAVALWLDRDGVTVESANESRGDRPWVPRPRPTRRATPAAVESAAGWVVTGYTLIVGRRLRPHRHRFVDGPNPEREDQERADCKGHLIAGHPLASEDSQDAAAKNHKNDAEAAEHKTHGLRGR